MKKGSAITGFLTIAFVAFSIVTVSAQQMESTTNTDVRAGGLGTGLNSMVRSILNEEATAPQSPTALPAAQTMMMKVDAAADASVASYERSMDARAMNTSFSMEAVVHTDEDVRELIRSLLKNNANMQSIDASDTHVRITYRTKGSVLRFLRVTMPVTAEAYVSGRTTVSYPWYATRAGVKSDIRTRFDARISPQIETGSITASNRIQLINEMHAFFSDEFATKI